MPANDLPPSVWQQRRMRIAQENAERLRRKQERERARSAAAEEGDDEEDAQPAQKRARPRPKERARASKASAIVTRDRLKTQRGGIERASAWIVLLISFVGSVAALHGGFGPMIATFQDGQLNVGALLGGILIQLVLTFLEWWYFDNWRIAWSARIVDAATTALGYGPLFLAPLVAILYNQGATYPVPIAWVIIGLISLGIAWFPENRLVD